MELERNELKDFSLLEMSVVDGDDLLKVIFMGRWLVECFSMPSSDQPAGILFNVALTPSDSYFVFREQPDAPEFRRYEVYDCFEWMEESLEIPRSILDAISSAMGRELDMIRNLPDLEVVQDNEALEA